MLTFRFYVFSSSNESVFMVRSIAVASSTASSKKETFHSASAFACIAYRGSTTDHPLASQKVQVRTFISFRLLPFLDSSQRQRISCGKAKITVSKSNRFLFSVATGQERTKCLKVAKADASNPHYFVFPVRVNRASTKKILNEKVQNQLKTIRNNFQQTSSTFGIRFTSIRKCHFCIPLPFLTSLDMFFLYAFLSDSQPQKEQSGSNLQRKVNHHSRTE